MSENGRYRRLYVRVWRHSGFRSLSREDRELALYLLSGPQSNRVGIYFLTLAMVAEDLELPLETLRERLDNVCRTFGWEFDPIARVVFVPSWWKWNPPVNGNILAGSLSDLTDVPSCALVDKFMEHLDFLDRKYHATFRSTLRRRLVNVSSTLGKRSAITASAAATATTGSDQQRRKSSALRAHPLPLKADTPDDNAGVITKIAHEAIDDFGASHPDLDETVKSLCALRHIAYDSTAVRKAIDSALVQRQLKLG